MSLPDYSKWLTPRRLAQEEMTWVDPRYRTWPIFVAWLETLNRRDAISSVVEFGCGTGLVPAALPFELHYVGVDANPKCIEIARARNSKHRQFFIADVRTVPLHPQQFSIACGFSFFKHFGLDEWDTVVARVLGFGRWGLFSMPVGPITKDEGEEFPHVWVTTERLHHAVDLAGHKVVESALLPGGEHMVITSRVREQARRVK